MLSPGEIINVSLSTDINLRIYTSIYSTKLGVLPLSSSAAKKAARQSSRVTMGPQNQLGMHDTTNLSKETKSLHKHCVHSECVERETDSKKSL